MQIDSAAYHEAGHIAAAIVQGMPIRASGMYVDMLGHGVAYYFERLGADPGTTDLDMIERKRTIIALYSAHVAQLRFYPAAEKSGWFNDHRKIEILSREIHSNDETAEIAIREELWERAHKLIDKFWPIVSELAKALLAKPGIAMPPEELDTGWGTGPVRHMSGSEIADYCARHKINAIVLDPYTQHYESASNVPHYDSLA